MSRNELVEAYLEGKISRRGFIRGMAATGASLTMAAAAADQLRVSAQDDGGDGGGMDPYGPYGETPTVIASPTQVVPSPTATTTPDDIVVLPTGTAPVEVTKEPKTPTKEPKTPTKVVVNPTEAPKTGGGGTTGGGAKTGGGGGATTLPETGVGQDAKSGILTPIALAASAAAAAVAFRVRQFRKPAESDAE